MEDLWVWIILIVITILAYLLGSVNSSILITKCMGADIREHGSGNAGATNMLRTYGKRFGALVLVCDVLKGLLAVGGAILVEHMLAARFGAAPSIALSMFSYCAAIAVVLGHNYPVFFGFRGGKGIATSGAVIFLLDWRIGLIVAITGVLLIVLTRYVSLGSIVAAVAFPVVTAIFTFWIDRDENVLFFICSIIIGLLAIVRHSANLRRLLSGTESKLGKKSDRPDQSK